MSSLVSLDIILTSKDNYFSEDIIKTLVSSGWNPLKNNKVTYLHIGDNDMYNWTSNEITISELFQIIKTKEKEKEIIGLELYYLDSEIGCNLLMFNPKKFTLMISINKKYINKDFGIIDFNWYAEKIIPHLYKKFNILEYKFEFRS